jgi:hypothetical protein
MTKFFPKMRDGSLDINCAKYSAATTQMTGSLLMDVGAGTKEIRIKQSDGAFRVMYVAKFEDAIYVLHCFKKKTQKTSQKDKNLSTQRYKDMTLTRSKK